jgi:predicted ATP-grasp superfamily ATP-dependent carboligase
MKRLMLIRGFGRPEALALARSLRGFAEVVTVLVRLPRHGARPLPESDVLATLGPVLAARGMPEIVPVAFAYAREHPVDGVLTFSELTIVEAAAVAADLGLRHHSWDAVTATTNKYRQREKLCAAGVPVPAFALVDDADPQAALRSVPLPALLKPVRGTGSTATAKIDASEQLAGALAAVSPLHSRTLLWPGDEPQFLLEEFLRGEPSSDHPRLAPYVAVESIVQDGEPWHMGITDKLPQAPAFRETGHLVPSVRSAMSQRALTDVATAAVRALGLRDGAVQTEIQLTRHGPRVIEVNPRVGGSVCFNYSAAGDVDVIRECARVALGEQIEARRDFRRQAMIWCPQTPPRDVTLLDLAGVDSIAATPEIVEIWAATPPRFMRWQVAGPTGGTLLRSHSVHGDRDGVWGWLDHCSHLLRPVYADGRQALRG